MDGTDKSCILVVDRTAERERLLESLAVVPVEVRESATAEAALKRVRERRPDLVLCEIQLPDASGFSLCRRLREQRETQSIPVILISDWASEMDRILAFECGADDFVAKPFYERELASRVAALLRRGRSEIKPTQGASARKEQESSARAAAVVVDERIVPLTRKEQEILRALASSKGHVLTRRELIERVWGAHNSPSPRSVDAHIKSLRRKLGCAADVVSTVRGVGYRFTPNSRLRFD